MRAIGPSVYSRALFPQFLWPRSMEPTLTVHQVTMRRVRAPQTNAAQPTDEIG